MLTPEYIDSLGGELLGLYDALETSIVEDIARRIVKTGYLTDSAQWQVIQAQQSGMLMNDVIDQVASVSGYSKDEVARIFEEAGAESIKRDSVNILAATGRTIAIAENGAMRRLLDENIKLINREVGNLTGTTAVMSQMSYINATNLAYMQVTSGAFSYQTAIARAIKSAASDGAKISFPSGRSANIDTAIRRAVLTGVNQTAGKLTETYASEMGCEYYETSAHAGARPSHEDWQGQVFKINGSASSYPNFYDATGYGTGEGLCGWNCRHSFHPFWPGISKRAYSTRQLTAYSEKTTSYNGVALTEYEASQLQRKQERDIRASKRTLSGLNAAIKETDDDLLMEELKKQYEAESVTLKAREKRLKDFCSQTNRSMDSARVQVHAVRDEKGRITHFDRSAAQRAVQANKRALAKYSEYHYNKDGTIVVTDYPSSIRPKGKPNEVAEVTSKKGGKSRYIYDGNGVLVTRIDNNNHGNSKRHPFGKNGEHAHDISFDGNGKMGDVSRELTDRERKEHSDIL